jgi:hypothetical protein
MNEEHKLPVAFKQESSQEVAVVDKKALAKAAKAAEEKEIAKIHQQFNGRVMRVKTRLLAQVGIDIERWGAKKIGHGRLHCAGDNADRAIAAIQEDIDRLLAQNPDTNPAVLAELRAVQWRFNKQIIEVGQLHLDAAKDVAAKGLNTNISFPAGQQVVVAVTPPKLSDPEKTLTDGKPAA